MFVFLFVSIAIASILINAPLIGLAITAALFALIVLVCLWIYATPDADLSTKKATWAFWFFGALLLALVYAVHYFCGGIAPVVHDETVSYTKIANTPYINPEFKHGYAISIHLPEGSNIDFRVYSDKEFVSPDRKIFIHPVGVVTTSFVRNHPHLAALADWVSTTGYENVLIKPTENGKSIQAIMSIYDLKAIQKNNG